MYKVRVKLVQFLGDVDHFPCHFGYEVGDEFIYDGEKFIGRICPSLFPTSMISIINTVRFSGNRQWQYHPWVYTGFSKRDPEMERYDGVGWANIKGAPEGAKEAFVKMTLPIPTERRGIGVFQCDDPRTLAQFIVEPIGLSDKGYDRPFYFRSMSILEKIKAEPGLTADEILNKFSKWEREEIYPILRPALMSLLLEELAVIGYVDVRDGEIFPVTESK